MNKAAMSKEPVMSSNYQYDSHKDNQVNKSKHVLLTHNVLEQSKVVCERKSQQFRPEFPIPAFFYAYNSLAQALSRKL